ncbi:hypothetical protein OC861_002312 [Tilletia horrida]|nr:hypothetical protein OC861_002312 [Tilletia horrida]
MARKKKAGAGGGGQQTSDAAQAAASQAAAAHAQRVFNLSVLRKHIPAISTLASSASFVVLYIHSEESGSWTKTGIEGPLFLFSIDQSWASTPAARALASIAPNKAPPPHATHGFIILNRNGLENFVVYISAADDLEVTPEFILYRPDVPLPEDDEDGAGPTFAIWVFEEQERQLIGQELEQLHALATNVAIVPEPLPSAAPASASSTAPVPSPHTEAPAAPASAQTLLDLLFQSVSQTQPIAAA